MSSTIDNLNNNILIKIQWISEVLEVFDGYELETLHNKQVANSIVYLEETKNQYEFGSIEILKNYYLAKGNEEKKKQYQLFTEFIITENIIGKLKKVYLICKKINKYYNFNNKECDKKIYDYDFLCVDVELSHTKYVMCSCGNQQFIESKTSEFICQCGKIEKLYGVVFEDEQFFYQEGQRTKHGKYAPTKHCKYWVERIQAKESSDISEIIDEIKSKIKRDKIWLENVNCQIIRNYLKEAKKTKFNDHAALIRKIITGYEPPQLTEHELKLIYVYFGRVIQIFNKIKPDDKNNSPYHPFFIYKIIENILKHPKDKKRKSEILECIHLQSRDTIISHDMIWELICAEIKDFKYTPTSS